MGLPSHRSAVPRSTPRLDRTPVPTPRTAITTGSASQRRGPRRSTASNSRSRTVWAARRSKAEPTGRLPAARRTRGKGGAPPTFSLGAQKLGGTTDTLFHLIDADGILACGDTVTQGGSGGTTPASSLERLDNDSGSCVPIPYNLD